MFYYKIIQTLSTGTIFYVCLKIVKFENYKNSESILYSYNVL